MRRLPFAAAVLLAFSAAAQAGVSLVAESPEAAPGTASPSVDPPGAAPRSKIENPFAKPTEPVAAEVEIDAHADPRCTFRPPAAALVAAHYPDYRAQRSIDDPNRSPGDLTETATLADGTRLRVVSYGCVDSTGHTFEFTYARPQHAAKETAFWAAQAHRSFAALALHEVPGAQQLGDWLVHAGTLKRRDDKIVQCHDKTQPPDNVCNWDSGGGFSLAIQARGDAIAVTVGVDYSG